MLRARNLLGESCRTGTDVVRGPGVKIFPVRPAAGEIIARAPLHFPIPIPWPAKMKSWSAGGGNGKYS